MFDSFFELRDSTSGLRAVSLTPDIQQSLLLNTFSALNFDDFTEHPLKDFYMGLNLSDEQKECLHYLCLVGNTPLIELPTLNTKVKLFVDIQAMQSGFSVKFGGCINMIKGAEANAFLQDLMYTKGVLHQAEKTNINCTATVTLRPGDRIVESSSGNMGMALAIMSKIRGYKCTIILDAGASDEKIRALKYWGADVMLVKAPAGRGSSGEERVKLAQKLSKEKGWVWLEQLNNLNNIPQEIGHNICTKCPQVTDLFIPVGSGAGTLGGIEGLAETNPNNKVKVHIVDPDGSVLVSDDSSLEHFGKSKSYKIRGSGQPSEDSAKNDLIHWVKQKGVIGHKATDKQAYQTLLWLADNFGIWTGSAGASALFAAIQAIKDNKIKVPEGQVANIVAVLTDSGVNYKSELSNPDFIEQFKSEEVLSVLNSVVDTTYLDKKKLKSPFYIHIEPVTGTTALEVKPRNTGNFPKICAKTKTNDGTVFIIREINFVDFESIEKFQREQGKTQEEIRAFFDKISQTNISSCYVVCLPENPNRAIGFTEYHPNKKTPFEVTMFPEYRKKGFEEVVLSVLKQVFDLPSSEQEKVNFVLYRTKEFKRLQNF